MALFPASGRHRPGEHAAGVAPWSRRCSVPLTRSPTKTARTAGRWSQPCVPRCLPNWPPLSCARVPSAALTATTCTTKPSRSARSAESRIRFTHNGRVCRFKLRQGRTFAVGRLVAKRQRTPVCIVSAERPTARGRGSFDAGVRSREIGPRCASSSSFAARLSAGQSRDGQCSRCSSLVRPVRAP